MYLRLWWKDARQFWPIWAFLMLAAGVTQLLFHHYGTDEIRENVLGPLAMGWAGLYAFAVGAAAFAGERESGTLRMLDLLPASRRIVWAGKVSFGFVTTLALGLLLFLLAMTDVPRPLVLLRIHAASDALPLGVLMLQCLAWGLLCSSLLSSALVAAVVAIVITALVRIPLADRYSTDPYQLMLADLAVTLALLVASLIIFALGRRGRFTSMGLELRSPVVLTGPGAARWAARRSSPPAPVASPAVEESTAASLSPTAATVVAGAPTRVIPSALWPASHIRPRSWFAELRFIAWKTFREGSWTFFFLVCLGVIGIVPLFSDPRVPPGDQGSGPLVYGLVALVAGVNVFGVENQRRSYRFLVHHGARPGVVWLAKMAAWCFGLTLVCGPFLYLTSQLPVAPRAGFHLAAMIALNLLLVFTIGVLCGMAIPRGITAWTIALVVVLVLLGIQTGLYVTQMIPIWGLAVWPVGLILISWLWTGDWLLDRPAPGRWIRLGLMVSTLFAASFGGFTAWRAWSVPDVGPIAMPASWAAASVPLPADRNAAPLYREAERIMENAIPPNLRNKPNLREDFLTQFDLGKHPDLLDLLRRASALPDCRFVSPDRITLKNRFAMVPWHELATLVANHARSRLSGGDMAGAWEDILVIFRMAHHLGEGATAIQGITALRIERYALELAQEWARDRSQTSDRLRAAITAITALPRIAPISEDVRGEGLLVERTLDLPRDELKDYLIALVSENRQNNPPGVWEMLLVDLASSPWEVARARRVNRLMTSEDVRLGELEPWQRNGDVRRLHVNLMTGEEQHFSLATLLRFNSGGVIYYADQTETTRRALVQVMAVRDWQLRHNGQFPAKLEDLVPDTLPTLPLDPYTNQPFGYTTFAQAARLAERAIKGWKPPDWPADTRLIYSAGPNLRHNPEPTLAGFDELTFPVMPASKK